MGDKAFCAGGDLKEMVQCKLQVPPRDMFPMPGDNIEFDAELITPIAMEKGVRFAIREGGHTVGAGVVTEVVE